MKGMPLAHQTGDGTQATWHHVGAPPKQHTCISLKRAPSPCPCEQVASPSLPGVLWAGLAPAPGVGGMLCWDPVLA